MTAHRKSAAAVFAAALLLLPALTGRAAAADWKDVPGHTEIRITLKLDGAFHEKFMNGTGDGLFQPDIPTTRAELAQILFNLLDQYPVPEYIPSFSDVERDAWYAPAVDAMTGLGIMDGRDDGRFHPYEPISRQEAATALYRLLGGAALSAPSRFPDVPEDHPAAVQIAWAADRGLFQGDEYGNFDPDRSLTRAESAAVINRLLGRVPGTAEQLGASSLRIFADVPVFHWAYCHIMEATVPHTQERNFEGVETWTDTSVEPISLPDGFHRLNGELYYISDGRFVYNESRGGIAFDQNGHAGPAAPGFHELDGTLYYADRYGNLVLDAELGAYRAGPTGALTQVSNTYQIPNVPYLSQIDGINAWVGCEPTAALAGLWTKGYAKDITLKYFLDNLPRSASDPEKGFVGSPYTPDRTKRTTIYPAKLAEYSNSYCGGDMVCSDFRGASVDELRRELLAGSCVVAYETLWWKNPTYGTYKIEGVNQRLVNNNHAVLVCGYDPDKGYFISDPYNYYNRGKVHQYWEDAETFDRIWNQRKVGMLMR